jgi:tRNA (guanine37-N1)-methyltransferase
MGCGESSAEESFSDPGLLEYPQYTRPREFRGQEVPDLLVSGNHAEIAQWRRRQALRRTALRRPELLPGLRLTQEERAWLEQEQKAAGGGSPAADVVKGTKEDAEWRP